MPVKVKRCVAVAFLCVLAVSHYVETKPAETLPNVPSKSESPNSQNTTPPNSGKHAPGDVIATPQPVGGNTKLQMNVEERTGAPTVPPPTTTTTTITTVTPVTSTTKANSTVVPTTQSSSSTTSVTTIATTTTNSTKAGTTPLPTTTTSKPSVTTTPVLETSTQSIPVKDRRFDGPSFIGGIVLCMGTMAIGFVAFKFYKARTERNYHTL